MPGSVAEIAWKEAPIPPRILWVGFPASIRIVTGTGCSSPDELPASAFRVALWPEDDNPPSAAWETAMAPMTAALPMNVLLVGFISAS
jgi:hypothetical protein